MAEQKEIVKIKEKEEEKDNPYFQDLAVLDEPPPPTEGYLEKRYVLEPGVLVGIEMKSDEKPSFMVFKGGAQDFTFLTFLFSHIQGKLYYYRPVISTKRPFFPPAAIFYYPGEYATISFYFPVCAIPNFKTLQVEGVYGFVDNKKRILLKLDV